MLHKNDKAVSPVVATLVLIVVAIIGAAAIGAILGAFSSDISKEANAEDLQSAASSELTVAGSTTVQPASELLAQAFMTTHPGIKVTVSGGGSDAGIAGVEMGAIDIGSSSNSTFKDVG
jgi:phosphate transport system substrate-binding protein